MEMDQIDVERQRRGMKSFAFIIIFIIAVSALFFLWGNVNKGKIKLIGDSPFNVQILGAEKIECPNSPCFITQRTGSTNLILTKEGYKSTLIDTKVKLWRTTEVKIVFQVIPTISTTGAIPEDSSVEYELILDKNTNLQKLINSSDKAKRAIIYLNKSLNTYQIFGDKNYAAIISGEDLYKIDVRAKSREKISKPEFFDIKSGKWSRDGRFFAFSREGFIYPFIMDTINSSIIQLSLIASIDQIAWAADNRVLFTTNQSYNTETSGSINLLTENSKEGISFGAYHPLKDEYYLFETFSNIKKIPEKINITANGDSIYFKEGEENYKITLKKF